MTAIRHDWTTDEVAALFNLPFNDLLFKAQEIHRANFDPNSVQTCTLLSIKTGACPEDCGYCSQSGHHNTGLEKEKLLPLNDVIEDAKRAKASGSTRFCMGAAWRCPPEKQMSRLIEMIKAVRELGLETCLTAGMLTSEQAEELKEAGLDYYNHNLDTSKEHYENIVTTRTYQDRLDTLARVRDAGINVCCGGILGLGETREDRISFLRELANLPDHPQSVPINQLVRVQGTPLGNSAPLDNLEFVRMLAVARIMMPHSMLRLSAGRDSMSDELQALCYFAGANSIFSGDKLLTTKNAEEAADTVLFSRLGIEVMAEAAL